MCVHTRKYQQIAARTNATRRGMQYPYRNYNLGAVVT